MHTLFWPRTSLRSPLRLRTRNSSKSSLPILALVMIGLLTQSVVAQAPPGFGATGDRARLASPNTTATGSIGWPGSEWLGTSTGAQRDWTLGIRGTNTETGVLVTDVTPNSAAARAQIESNDIIITVGGYQVGLSQGRLYDLSEEINRRADAAGQVQVIVQDHRTGRLASVPVQLASNQNFLRGSVVAPTGLSLPRDAMVTVAIENVSRPHYLLNQSNNTFPLNNFGETNFQVSYDPNYIYPQDVYQVRAYVTSAGRTILDSRQPQLVLTQGNPSQVRLNLQRLEQLVSNTSPTSAVTAGYPNYNDITDQLVAMYRRYLGRSPTALELAALRATPGISERLSSMRLELMAAQEYFDLAGNNSSEWLARVFKEIVGYPPSAQEIQRWLQRYNELGSSRITLLRQLDIAAASSRR